MRYAIIESGIVKNIIEAESDFAASIGAIPALNAGIGYTYSDGVFTSPIINPDIEVNRMRESLIVTPWQIRKALNVAGLREGVEAAVLASDQTTKDAWQYATEFLRLDPLVINLGIALGKTEVELDNLFILAKTL